MIITQNKNFEDILTSLGINKRVIILGCSECATVCKTGGEDEVNKLKEYLINKGIEVTADTVLSTSCNYLLTKKELKQINSTISKSDVIISMACGNGVQTISDIVDIPVFPANNTLFVGEKIRNGIFEENCRTCGECVLGRTAAICPVTKCAKGLLNGPCGGSKFGKCEVDKEHDCAWIEIYNRLEEMNKLELLNDIQPLRSYQNNSSRRFINNRNRHD